MATGRTAVRTRAAPRAGLRRGLVVAAVLALLALFLAVRFPWQRLLPPLLGIAQRATGAEVRVAGLRLGLGPAGPRVVASGVSLSWPGNEPLAFDRVALRPAWSLAWLRGQPRWHVEASGPPGSFAGEVARDRVAGELDAIEVAALPWILLGSPPPLQGRVSGAVDLALLNGAWQGTAHLSSGEPGSVDLRGLPVAIPYEQLEARLDVGVDRVNLPEARLEGPLVTASFAGSASPAGDGFASWPIDLEVEIERIDPNLGSYLGPLGIRLDAQGHASVRVTGTLSAPFLSGTGP